MTPHQGAGAGQAIEVQRFAYFNGVEKTSYFAP